MELILNTVRLLDTDQAIIRFIGKETEMKTLLAVAYINPDDYKELLVTPSLGITLSSPYGEVVLKAKESKDVPKGTILVPFSIYSNQLTGVDAGELTYKNIKVSVEITRDQPLEIKELVKKITKK